MNRKKTRVAFEGVLLILFFLLLAIQPAQSQTVCSYDEDVAAILNQVTLDSWGGWIDVLSGETTVTYEGGPLTITSRFSYAMFEGYEHAQAFGYLKQELEDMGYILGSTLVEHSYHPGAGLTWRNLVAILPGRGPKADEYILMTAHLDSISTDSYNNAPGAEDNASGVATLLEAARLFRHQQFDRTILFIFFTGEEQGLKGSLAYVADHPGLMDDIVGVVNLDMFGYDSDEDRCFELHVGTLAASDAIGQCYAASINQYALNLTYDYLTTDATTRSDHSSFWNVGVGAIEILENFFDDDDPDGCDGADPSPHYHKTTDTIDQMNLPVGLDIARGGIATTAGLAQPLAPCFSGTPDLSLTSLPGVIEVHWSGPEPEPQSALILRAEGGCEGEWDLIGTTSETVFTDPNILPGQTYAYRVEAQDVTLTCFSQASPCQTVTIPGFHHYLPTIVQ
jgi:leucyl aminopeptidase